MNRGKAEIFLIAGGRENVRKGADPLLEHILALAAGRRPAIAYIGAASGDDRDFLGFIGAIFKRAGAGQVLLAPMVSPTVNLKKTKAVLAECDLVFVSGGDVELGMNYLELSGLIPFLKQLYDAGKVFLGLSAGSIMLAQSWVRWPDAGNDATVETFPCLGLAPLFCDTHAEKEEWDELKVLLKLTGAAVGYGIPSGAALRVSANGSLLALGKPVQQLAWRGGVPERVGELPVP